MIIRLKRFSYGEYETEGKLIIGDEIFATIEQPWTPNPNGSPGGKPFESCVPDGMYTLRPFIRPKDNRKCYILANSELGVHQWPLNHTEGHGRDLCLIHKANWARQVQGCIAPGNSRRSMVDPKGDSKHPVPGVTSSRTTMDRIVELLGNKTHILSIENDTGAKDGN